MGEMIRSGMARSSSRRTAWPLLDRPLEAMPLIEALGQPPARGQVIVGPAGVGKTVLANMIVERTKDRIPVRVIALTELAGIPMAAFAPALAQLGVPNEPERAVASLMSTVGTNARRYLLFVDDLPRLDDVSAGAVYQLLRAFGVAMVATARLGERVPAPIQQMFDEDLIVRHDLAGLTADQVGDLLECRFDVRTDYADVRRLTDRTAGNPLYLRVLVERAERDGRIRQEGDVVRIDDGDTPVDLVDAMTRSLADLTDPERRLLRLAAVLQPVARAVLVTSPTENRHLTALESRGLVATDPASGRLRLVHPLIAESITGDEVNDRDIREAVQRLLATREDADRLLAITILLAHEPPPIRELTWAAEYAYDIGDVGLAGDLAAALLKRDADRADRFTATLILAGTRSLSGALAEADRRFSEADQLAESPEELVLLALRRGEHLSYRRYDPAAAIVQAERIRDRLSARTGALDDSVDQWGASVEVIAGMPLLGRIAFRLKPELTIRAATLVAVSRASRGDLASARSAMAELSRIQHQIGRADPLAAAAVGFATFVETICAGRVGDAATYLEAQRIDAGDGIGVYTMLLGNLRRCGGRLVEAENLTTLAVDQLRWRDGLGLLGVALGYQANVIAQRGRTDEARVLLDAMTRAQRAERYAFIQVAEAEAWIRIHAGETDLAAKIIAEAINEGAERGAVFLSALAACIPIRLGHLDVAVELLDGLVIESPTELELVTCIRDLAVALKEGDHVGLVDVLGRVEAAGQEPTVLDAISIALRQHPPAETRRKLDLAWDRIASSVDERPLYPKKPLLTARELEVAIAAGTRERSKEIATRLGTSTRTVETQLQSVYRKLGVTSRDALRGALDDAGLLNVPDRVTSTTRSRTQPV